MPLSTKENELTEYKCYAAVVHLYIKVIENLFAVCNLSPLSVLVHSIYHTALSL